MPTYISLIRYTQQGAQNIRESPKRSDAARQAYQSLGGQLREFYLVLGEYDAVVIGEAPDDETAAKFALATGSLGNVRTETLRAFTEEEFRRLISDLP